MRVALAGVAAAVALLAAPGTASADVIFDPADAEDLAGVLADATAEQDVCYGWDVQVSGPVAGTEVSVGSNFGAGRPVNRSQCDKTVQFMASITYTSESSELEDSATYDVVSSPGGPTRADLDALDLGLDGLTGDDPDVAVGKAVAALPLLAADTGLAEPIEATPDTGTTPADARLTDSPGSDFWRNSGGAVLWGGGLLLAGGLFAWWVFWSSRRRWRAPPDHRPAAVEDISPYIPDTVPPEFYDSEPTQTPPPRQAPAQTEPTQTEPTQRPAPAAEAQPESPSRSPGAETPRSPESGSPPAEASEPDEPTAGRRESTSDRPAERSAPPDQKDKE